MFDLDRFRALLLQFVNLDLSGVVAIRVIDEPNVAEGWE